MKITINWYYGLVFSRVVNFFLKRLYLKTSGLKALSIQS